MTKLWRKWDSGMPSFFSFKYLSCIQAPVLIQIVFWVIFYCELNSNNCSKIYAWHFMECHLELQKEPERTMKSTYFQVSVSEPWIFFFFHQIKSYFPGRCSHTMKGSTNALAMCHLWLMLMIQWNTARYWNNGIFLHFRNAVILTHGPWEIFMSVLIFFLISGSYLTWRVLWK